MHYYVEAQQQTVYWVHGTPVDYTTEVDAPEEIIRAYSLAQSAFDTARENLLDYVNHGRKLGAIPRRRVNREA